MMSEILAHLLRANLVVSVAVLGVLACRSPARRLFGPETAYWLWAAPPLAALATLMPAPSVEGADGNGALAAAVASVAGPLLALWALGVLLAVAALVWAQRRFLDAVRLGHGGPAAVGIFAPRIVMPADDGAYTEAERALIRAHERAHVARQDPCAGALGAALQALCWFNPLVHLGVRVMRLDQELACDAAVLRHRPADRCLYARTLLKTQLASQAPPFGCAWPSRARHPLEIRLGQLRDIRQRDSGVGQMLVASLLAMSALTAWSLQPPVPRHPPPIVALWEADKGPTMSVMLIRQPPLERDAS